MDLDLKALKLDKKNSLVEARTAQFSLPESIWDSYSAFANTNGGKILLGVSENKETKELTVSGIDDPDTVKKQFWDTINNPRKVSCNILTENDLDEIKLENGKTIFIITVPKARLGLRPVYINNDIANGSFKRNHVGDCHLTREEVSRMLRDASPYSYDQKVYEELPLSVLSDDTINKYRRYHEGHRENPWSNLPKEQYLLMLGAAAFSASDSAVHPTMAGLLMFGEEHVITRFFPDYFLDYRENLDPGKVRWTDRVQSISGEWSGNVFDFYLLVNNKLVMDLKVPFKLRGMERIDNTPLHDAVREAFINCLSNADYFGRCGIVIRKNVDSIVYENPGSIRVGKEQMMHGGISDARNKTIMKMFNLLGYGEKAGSGIPMIIQATEELGLPIPRVEENTEFDRTYFTIFLRQTNSQNEISGNEQGSMRKHPAKSPEPEEKGAEPEAHPEKRRKEESVEDIVKILNDQGPANARYISASLGLSLRRTRELLAEMMQSGKIISTGSFRTKVYLLPKKVMYEKWQK